ncbi:hypothetical protein V8C37DRAFT_380123 [Trichoderma ceciliae]
MLVAAVPTLHLLEAIMSFMQHAGASAARLVGSSTCTGTECLSQSIDEVSCYCTCNTAPAGFARTNGRATVRGYMAPRRLSRTSPERVLAHSTALLTFRCLPPRGFRIPLLQKGGRQMQQDTSEWRPCSLGRRADDRNTLFHG